MQAIDNYYNILNVSVNSSIKDITQNYRKLAIKYHPDKNPDNVDQFTKINEAYEILKNDDSRKEYDIKLKQQNNNMIESYIKQTIHPIEIDLKLSLYEMFHGTSVNIIFDRIIYKKKYRHGYKIKQIKKTYNIMKCFENAIIIFENDGNILKIDNDYIYSDLIITIKRKYIDEEESYNIINKISIEKIILSNADKIKFKYINDTVIELDNNDTIIKQFGLTCNNEIGDLYIKFIKDY